MSADEAGDRPQRRSAREQLTTGPWPRLAAAMAGLGFVGAAVLQTARPPEFVYILIYAYAAMLSLMFALNVGVRLAAAYGALGYALLCFKLGPSPAVIVSLIYAVALAALSHFRATR